MDSLIPHVEKLLRRVAKQEILSRFGKLSEQDIRYKDGRNDIVTKADFEAEHWIRDGLLKLRPDSVVIGEEEAFKSPDILKKLSKKNSIWVVDPVDGTRNFATGKPCFAVICALIEDGKTQMGWILDPIADVCITAKRGHGVYLGPQQMHMASSIKDIPDLTGSVEEGLQKRFKKLKSGEKTTGKKAHGKGKGLKIPKHFVRYHCVGREYMDMILGKIHFCHYGGKMMPWDHAAGVLMVEEAGGYVGLVNKKRAYSPLKFGPENRLIAASNQAVYDAVLPVLTGKS